MTLTVSFWNLQDERIPLYNNVPSSHKHECLKHTHDNHKKVKLLNHRKCYYMKYIQKGQNNIKSY